MKLHKLLIKHLKWRQSQNINLGIVLPPSRPCRMPGTGGSESCLGNGLGKHRLCAKCLASEEFPRSSNLHVDMSDVYNEMYGYVVVQMIFFCIFSLKRGRPATQAAQRRFTTSRIPTWRGVFWRRRRPTFGRGCPGSWPSTPCGVQGHGGLQLGWNLALVHWLQGTQPREDGGCSLQVSSPMFTEWIGMDVLHGERKSQHFEEFQCELGQTFFLYATYNIHWVQHTRYAVCIRVVFKIYVYICIPYIYIYTHYTPLFFCTVT